MGKNLQQKTKLTEYLCYEKKNKLRGMSAPAPGFYMYMTIISNIFSETAWQINAKFHVELPLEGLKKVYINGQCHMTMMVAILMW